VLLTTHYMDEAERLCDYISIIDHGQVIAAGTPAELISGVGGHHRVEFALEAEGVDGADLWRKLPGVGGVHRDAGITALTVEEPHLTIPALLAMVNERGWKLSQLTTRQSSLEDVFVNLTGRHLRED
jgi:ABC-2 type transport system ATP-binding protein